MFKIIYFTDSVCNPLWCSVNLLICFLNMFQTQEQILPEVYTFSFVTIIFVTVFLSVSLCCLPSPCLHAVCEPGIQQAVSVYAVTPRGWCTYASSRLPVTSLFVFTASVCIRLVTNQWSNYIGLTWRTVWGLREGRWDESWMALPALSG